MLHGNCFNTGLNDMAAVDVMSKSPAKAAEGGETALQLIKESLDEDLHQVAHVFVVLGASVCMSQVIIEDVI